MPPQFSCVPLRSTSENCAVLPCFSDFGYFPTAHFLTFPVCALLNVPRIPKPAHLRRASILRSKILAEVGFTSTEHFNYPWVKPPAARETKNAPSGASQAFPLCENLGAQAIHLFVRC
jgi:hypothetical protein